LLYELFSFLRPMRGLKNILDDSCLYLDVKQAMIVINNEFLMM